MPDEKTPYVPSHMTDIRKTFERQPEYRPPLEKVCPHCGCKHHGPFQSCISCKTALDRGQ